MTAIINDTTKKYCECDDKNEHNLRAYQVGEFIRLSCEVFDLDKSKNEVLKYMEEKDATFGKTVSKFLKSIHTSLDNVEEDMQEPGHREVTE